MYGILIEQPSAKRLLELLVDFEQFCLGEKILTPSRFSSINKDLSLGAVFYIGKYKIQGHDKHILWTGTDGREHDLGRADDFNITREYPGFHPTRSLSVGKHLVKSTEIIEKKRGKGTICKVTLTDGTIGFAPNYRMALRNAALKMQLKKTFNLASLSGLWKNMLWGNA